jgi:dTMP kinase
MALRQGLLIVFEGIDGSGKSTQVQLLKKKLREMKLAVRAFREPTHGKWGKKIREKAREAGSLTPEEELNLFVRDRRENVRRNLRPALAAKKIVLLDRYYFSTIAYQGGRGLDPEQIRAVNEEFAVKPDLVFILDIDPGKGLGRIKGRAVREAHFEREDYLVRVRKIFLSLRGRMFVRLDAGLPAEEISRRVFGRVFRLIRKSQE